MSAEFSSQVSKKEVNHGVRLVLFTGIALTSTAAACVNPLFAIPAVGAYAGMINEARHIAPLKDLPKE